MTYPPKNCNIILRKRSPYYLVSQGSEIFLVCLQYLLKIFLRFYGIKPCEKNVMFTGDDIATIFEMNRCIFLT